MDSEVIEVFLQPGEFFVGDHAYRVRTLLGSCVSFTIWHPGRRVGAMSHFLLASRHGEIVEPDARYGEEAMWLALRELSRLDIPPLECQAKIFGGGDMFPNRARSRTMDVGRRNGETARRLLRIYRIPLVAESLFGAGHRQIVFDIESGDVWSRQVRPGEVYAEKRKSA